MMDFEPAYDRLPLAQLAQRSFAFIIDFVVCSFVGQLVQALLSINDTSFLAVLIFAFVWIGDRVIIAGINKGQSIGRWAISLRVVDAQYGRSAGTFDLFKREALLYFFVLLILFAYNNGGLTRSTTLFSVIPLVTDIVFAAADSRRIQTLHDKLGGTIVIVTRKGFQLGTKMTKVFSQISDRSTQFYQNRYQNRERDDNRYADRRYTERYEKRASKRQYDDYDSSDRYDGSYDDRYDNRSGDTYDDDYEAPPKTRRPRSPRRRRP